MANLQDVARAANVSKTTVSRYLNGSLDLPARTAGAIDEAIRKLSYVPNAHARRLSLGRSDTVALVVPDIATPFFATFVAAVEAEADQRGLTLSLHATLNRPDREMSYLDHIRQGHADGLIFITNHAGDAGLVEKINAAGPCVIVDEDVAGTCVPKLFVDNETGGYLAGKCLAQAGHRHVLFIGAGEQMLSGARRFAGFRRGLREGAVGDLRIERHCGSYTLETGREAARAFIAQGAERPTAIFASSDEMVIGLFEVLHAVGISVPHDVSVVGFDDVGPLHLFAPGVTAVRQPVRRLGKRALECLLDFKPGEPGTLPEEELLPVTLIERDSVAPPI
ncbi:MAG: LacI family DNA-binding transcriptional regulator [Tropicimonas sp.]|uniref:LacI family DNA-binding transcriptional regulator n=1 Tax=Tropicimonas sp. TaxID=2067044 RepID=UPI003A87DDC4